MKCVLGLITMLSVTFAPAFVVAQGKPVSNYEHLKELDKWVGRWQATGENFDGTEYVAEHVWHWGLGKNFLMGTFIRQVDGQDRVIAKTMIGWDGAEKKIKGYEFWDDSQGDFNVHEQGKITGSGRFHSGEPFSFDGELSWEDEDTQEYRATIKKGDEEIGVWKVTLKRMKPEPKAPEVFVKACSYFVGDWATESNVAGVLHRGSWTARWSPEKACLVTRWKADLPTGPAAGTRIHGWDASTEELLVADFGNDGSSAIERYKIVSDQIDEGQIAGVDAQGKSYKATARTDRMSREQFTWTVTKNGEVNVHTFHRVKK